MAAFIPEEYEKAVQRWLESAVPAGVTVVYARDKRPRPDEPYVTHNVIAKVRQGRPAHIVKNEAYQGKFKGTMRQHYIGTISINAFGPTARSIISDIEDSIWLPDTREAALADGLSLARTESSVDATEVIGTDWQARSQMDVFFNWSNKRLYAADVIESAEATENIT